MTMGTFLLKHKICHITSPFKLILFHWTFIMFIIWIILFIKEIFWIFTTNQLNILLIDIIYSYSTSNEEDYIRNDLLSLASAEPYQHELSGHHEYRRNSLLKQNMNLMNSIQEETPIGPTPSDNGYIVTPNGDNEPEITPGPDPEITPGPDDDQDNEDNQEQDDNDDDVIHIMAKKKYFNEATIKHVEFFRNLYDEVYRNKNMENQDPRKDIYGNIISFMGRHDRWLNCRLVCKSWNDLVYNKYWIFTPHLSMEQANKLRCHDKVDHRDDAGRFIKSTITDKNGTNLKIHYDGWSSKWDSWCDYSDNLHRFALARSISRCPRVRGKHIEEKMFVDIKPSYRHGKNGHGCSWRKGKVRRLDDYSGQIEVIYKYKQKKYLLWVHLDNKDEVDPVGKHTKLLLNNNSSINLNKANSDRFSNNSVQND